MLDSSAVEELGQTKVRWLAKKHHPYRSTPLGLKQPPNPNIAGALRVLTPASGVAFLRLPATPVGIGL